MLQVSFASPVPLCCSSTPLPTIFGSNRVDGALGEPIFHDAPAGAVAWDVPRASLYGQLRTVLIPRRPLDLVDLTGWAHKKLRIEGRQLVEVPPSKYPTTALWARRFHHDPTNPDGIYRRPRQSI
jgi:hypothetical protein